VTGAAVTAGALAAKVAVVVIVAGALAATAGPASHRLTAEHAHGRASTPVESRGVAGRPAATLIAEHRGAGKGHQPSALGRPQGKHGAKARLGAPRHGGKSAGKTAPGAGNGVGNGAARSNAAVAHSTSVSARGAAASADGRARGSSSNLKPSPHYGSQALSALAGSTPQGRSGADKPEPAADPPAPPGP